MFSKLTLENLEKRKSLVYNRELSTSLKIAQDNVSSSSSINNTDIEDNVKKCSTVLSELEEVITRNNNNSNKLLTRHNSCSIIEKPIIDSNLPNFKISTYNKPKSRINIFEDDSIRSNVDSSLKSSSFVDIPDGSCSDATSSTKPYCYEKMYLPNTPFRRMSTEKSLPGNCEFKKPQEYVNYGSKYKTNAAKYNFENSNNVVRSESFTANNVWKPQNRVQRSRSQIMLNKNNQESEVNVVNDDYLQRSNSLFDVSGLQSLEVCIFFIIILNYFKIKDCKYFGLVI